MIGTGITHTYSFPRLGAVKDLVVTNDRETAKRYIGQGYTLFTVPQMFGEESGIITLYLEPDSHPVEDSSAVLEEYEQGARRHILGGGVSNGHVNDSH